MLRRVSLGRLEKNLHRYLMKIPDNVEKTLGNGENLHRYPMKILES